MKRITTREIRKSVMAANTRANNGKVAAVKITGFPSNPLKLPKAGGGFATIHPLAAGFNNPSPATRPAPKQMDSDEAKVSRLFSGSPVAKKANLSPPGSKGFVGFGSGISQYTVGNSVVTAVRTKQGTVYVQGPFTPADVLSMTLNSGSSVKRHFRT